MDLNDEVFRHTYIKEHQRLAKLDLLRELQDEFDGNYELALLRGHILALEAEASNEPLG